MQEEAKQVVGRVFPYKKKGCKFLVRGNCTWLSTKRVVCESCGSSSNLYRWEGRKASQGFEVRVTLVLGLGS